MVFLILFSGYFAFADSYSLKANTLIQSKSIGDISKSLTIIEKQEYEEQLCRLEISNRQKPLSCYKPNIRKKLALSLEKLDDLCSESTSEFFLKDSIFLSKQCRSIIKIHNENLKYAMKEKNGYEYAKEK